MKQTYITYSCKFYMTVTPFELKQFHLIPKSFLIPSKIIPDFFLNLFHGSFLVYFLVAHA